MTAINPKKIEKVKHLYESGMGAKDISEKIGVSMDAVYYFFRKHKIPRRNRKEINNLLFKNKEATFKIKNTLIEAEKELKVSGIMLYWGEGSKWDGEKIVDFANSNSEMILIFLKFLRKICGIRESKLRIYLYCYGDQDINKLMSYWSKITKISKSQFTKPYIRQDFSKNKSGKMKYGLIHIRYNDKKLLYKIKEWIEEYKNKFI
jgi:hypothetical protein